jgi:hypothetical protein
VDAETWRLVLERAKTVLTALEAGDPTAWDDGADVPGGGCFLRSTSNFEWTAGTVVWVTF